MQQPFEPLGLTENEAAARLREYGPNLIAQGQRRGFADVLSSTLREPMLLLLLAAAALYLLFGELLEGLFLVAGAILTLGLVVVQELRSERALEALQALAEPRATVIRGGAKRSIPSSELVPGDLLMLGEGCRLPADAELIRGDVLTVDESALTGESAPVHKRPGDEAGGGAYDPGVDLVPSLFASTLVLEGQGLALVSRTAAATRFGHIADALATIEEEPSLVQKQVRRLIARLGWIALGFCVVVAVSYGIVHGNWFEGALRGITLAISLVPEEVPMVLAVFMALGAWRLARRNVLVRRSAVIETLGATTVLCVDKTGTITENRMSLACVWTGGRCHDLTRSVCGEVRPLLEAAARASAVHAHDPMDAAVHRAAGPHAGSPLRSYPLRPDFLAFVQVWPAPEEDGAVVYAAKGAPETIFALCGSKSVEVEHAVDGLADRGMRVLGVAEAILPADSGSDPAKLAYEFRGLLGFLDPVRADVPAAIAEARRAGIEVVMITGDYPATAAAIAQQAGIRTSTGVLVGSEVSSLMDIKRLTARVFARVSPEQKLTLVKAFKQGGHIVAMTGDGINDGPALAAADIGIAMGIRGTDVARESADLILLDDRFASIVAGIALGRRIFANLRQAIVYITAIHIPVAGLALLPILLGLPPILFPMHVVLIELMIDPLCSLVFEQQAAQPTAMMRPPRPAREPLFGRRELATAVVQGIVVLAVVMVLYVALLTTRSDEAARASAFLALAVAHLTLAFVAAGAGGESGQRPGAAFWAVGGGTTIMLVLTLTLDPLTRLLRFAPLGAADLAVSIALGALAGAWPLLGRIGPMFNSARRLDAAKPENL